MSNEKCRGILIAFEGCDGVGKTTHTELLKEKIKTSTLISFPDRKTCIGKIIDSYLSQNKKLNDNVIHLLFSANRWEQKDVIKGLLDSGVDVILDRYVYSRRAYAKALGLDKEWCESSDRGLPKPDIVFLP